MEMKFTKGDWGYKMNPEIADYVWVEGANNNIIAHIHRVESRGDSREESIANLNLVTAAPDLFYALLDLYENIDNLSCEYFTEENPLFQKAKLALIKAGAEL